MNPDGKVLDIAFGDGKQIPDSDVITEAIKQKYLVPSSVTPLDFTPV